MKKNIHYKDNEVIYMALIHYSALAKKFKHPILAKKCNKLAKKIHGEKIVVTRI